MSLFRLLKKLDEFFGSIGEEGGIRMLLILLGFSTFLFLLYQILAITFRYPLDYGEAPLVDQALRLTEGENIYRNDLSEPPYTISNYPPLYVLSLVPFLKVFGTSFIAGRVISSFSALLTAILLVLIVKNLTRDRLAGAISGLFFLAFPYVVSWSSLLRIDLLALGLSVTGLYFLARWPLRQSHFIVGAAFLVAAIYTRQSYALAAPMAAFSWLLTKDKRRAFTLAVLVGGISLFLFLMINVLTQGGFFFNIVTANVNEFGIERLKYNLDRLVDTTPVLLFVGAFTLVLVRQRWNPAWPLGAPYLLGAALSAMTIGKIGSNINYFLELCVGLSLAAGCLVAWSRSTLNAHFVRFLVLVGLAIQTAMLISATLREPVAVLRQRLAYVNELRQLERIVADSDGAALADEYMGMLTLQGRHLVIQPFEVTQLAWAGIWDQTPFVESIEQLEYSLILIHYFPGYPVYQERWTQEMLRAIESYYIPTQTLAETRIYQPKTSRTTIEACPGVSWLLPSSATLGVQWKEHSLIFFGWGPEGKIPVYAVADGTLTRLPGWTDSLAILHDDPYLPGEKVWSLYQGMASASGARSYVAGDFPQGSQFIPVDQGEVIGYQGRWSGSPTELIWNHARFSVYRADKDKPNPENWADLEALNPTLYLGLAIKPTAEMSYSQELLCKTK